MRKTLVLIGILFTTSFLITSCSSDRASEEEALKLIDKDVILKDVKVLSADDMEGRGAGTEGERKASEYIAKRFKENGLEPVNGSYFQSFKMVGTKKITDKSSLKITKGSEELEYKSNETLTYWSTSPKEVVDIKDAPVVFVGYGVQAPEYNWDDFKGTDVKGKVLLFLNNDPPVTENGKELFKGKTRTYYGRWTYKFEQAMRLGAAGAIMIHTTPSASYSFRVVQYNGAEENFALDLPGSGYKVDLLAWIDKATSNEIAQSMGTDLDGLFEMGAKRDFQPIDTGYKVTAHIENAKRTIETRNVIGILPGSDPELKEQVIVFSAHYDHLGKNEELESEDKIYNGAWDNALGTSCIINIAKAFSALENPPRRSVLFLACAAEESGTLGSRWFAQNPPFNRSRLVANFNVDMPQIFGVTSDMSAIGVEMNTLGDALREVALQYSVTDSTGNVASIKIKGDLNPNAGGFYRSDQVNFAKAGIPALYVGPGNDYLTQPKVDIGKYGETHYHQLADEVDEAWNLSGCQRDMRVLFQTALKVANKDEMPRWEKGNEFEEKWKELHGISE